MDLISNTITILRNAHLSKNTTIYLPILPSLIQFLQILKDEGFIESYQKNSKTQLVVNLKYKGRENTPILTNIRRISKPGRRVYTSSKEIPILFGGLGLVILSTSKGLLTSTQARALKIGGEILCSIW